MRGDRHATRRSRLGAALAAAVLACLTAGGCSSIGAGRSAPSPVESAPATARTSAGPALDADAGALHGARTYSGTYSCDGCVERTLTVTVFADGHYRLREVPARGAPIAEQGRWSAAPSAPDRLVLESAGGARVLRRTAPDELTIVDHEGRELHGLKGGVLTRLPDVDPLPDSERFVGTYRRDARRVLVDCASGEARPVLAGPDGSAQAALDRAWSELAPRDDESVLVVVHAHRVVLDASAGTADREALVVDAFERATRNGRCDEALSMR